MFWMKVEKRAAEGRTKVQRWYGLLVGGFSFAVWVAFMSACTKSETVQPSDLRYFPLDVGRYWLYQVEETNILRTGCNDNGETTARYELLVTIVDSFPNSNRETTYRMTRATRSSADASWQTIGTWSATVSGAKIVTNESNINYVKLLIPFYEGLTWDGNQLNSEQQLNGKVTDEYEATMVGKAFTSELNQTYSNTVTVLQNDEQKNILYRDTRNEVYAIDIGLVYKESYLLNYFADSQLPCYAQNRTQQGTILKQTLKEFGKD